MERIPTPEEVSEKLEQSDSFSEKEKSDFVENYRNRNYNVWLDGLKQKLNSYEPLFSDLDTRRSVSPSFNYSENDLKGEIWKEFPLDKRFTVSNLGRIKFEGKIQKQKDEKVGYCTLADEKLSTDYIYNFVACTFLGKIKGDGYHVHHITNDGYYNTEDNLILLTQEEHSYVHGFKIGG